MADRLDHNNPYLGWFHLIVENILEHSVEFARFNPFEEAPGELVAVSAWGNVFEEIPTDHILRFIAGALMGQGEMCLAGGEPRRADEVLRSIGIKPFEPGGKDALALVNGTSAMTGIAGLNGTGAERALRWSTLLCAGHAEVLDGRLEA